MSITASPWRRRAPKIQATRAARALAAVGAAFALVLTAALPAHADPIPEGDLGTAVYNFFASPDAVAGANDWSCTPTSAHPHPVILLPGTFANIGANFVKLAPRLHNAGYCVYATNYGMTSASGGRVGGLGAITDSAKQLDAFVAKVRQATGAGQVDIVGHSQGGSVPMWWIKKMDGARLTAHYVGWAPSSHGTSLNGLVTLADNLDLLGFATNLSNLGQFPGVLDQTYASDYTHNLWADGNTVPSGPSYTVISTEFDTVVTPYTSQALQGAGVNNIVLQDRCPWDFAGHVGMFNDSPTMQLTLNALADGPANFQPSCTGFGVQFL